MFDDMCNVEDGSIVGVLDGISTLVERKKWPPARLRAFGLER